MSYYDFYPRRRRAPAAAKGATSKNYGTTWWGKQWLNALSRIDYSNRLPRGKTYANKGLVQQLKFEQNNITAQVIGSRPRPYKIKITVPEFTGEERKRLFELVTENPLFLSKLLNRELPPELNEACLAANIHIFPSRWADFKGACSCPDWAVPCKHMAAVLYVVANEIDKNPFTVFDLHHFDLVAALQKSGFSQGETEDINIVKIQDLQQSVQTQKKDFEWNEAFDRTLDFSKIPANSAENLLRLLSEKPVFFPQGDFKKTLSAAYKNIEKQESNILTTQKQGDLSEKTSQTLLAAEDFLMVQDPSTSEYLGTLLLDEHGNRLMDFLTLNDLIRFLESIPAGILVHCSPSVRSLQIIFQFAAQLAKRGAFVPQLLCVGPNAYRTRFVPALLNEDVRLVFEQVQPLTATALLQYSSNDGDAHEPIQTDALSAILSVFLGFFVSSYSKKQQEEGVIPAWFLGGQAMEFGTFEHREYPKIVQIWTSRFFISEKDFVPVFDVTETSEGFFEVGVHIADKTAPLSVPISLSQIFADKQYAHLRLNALRDLSIVSEFFPPLGPHINSKGKENMRFDAQAFVSVFFDALPVIRLFGIRVLLPKALQNLLLPSASMKLSQKGKVSGTGLLSFANMIDFQWQIALGSETVSPEAFLEMVEKMRGIVRIADGYAFLDEKEMAALLRKIEASKQPSPLQLLQIALTEEYGGSPVVLDGTLRATIAELLKPAAVPLPKGLHATLRPYQIRGYEWLYKNTRLGFGSLIADDMGLGKTLQVIAALLRMKEEGTISSTKRAIIIVPTTLLTNWSNEIKRFAPSLSAHIYYGPNRKLSALQKAEVMLTTYGVLRSEIELLNKKDWAIAIIDEAQNIKNGETAQSKAAKKLKSPLRIAMTGTPVENRMSEYFSIFDFANHGLLGNAKNFQSDFAKPIELERNQDVLKRFQKLTAPFLIRRVKTDKSIISDLPDKIETNQYCTLTPEQAALYENVVQTSLAAIEQEAEEAGIRRQGLVLKMLTSLKQVCNHPANFLKKDHADAALSGKTQRLLDLLTEILAAGEKTLIFTQYREMGDLLVPLLAEKLGIEVPFLHGGCTRKQRDDMVEHFQKHHTARVLLLSLKAGGTGLNLTAASNVVHYDLWWNPAVEAQATDRAFRIGQQRNVQVHRFITQGTLEEKIDTMIQRKKELANLAVTAGEKWVGELSNAELRDLVQVNLT